MTTMLKAMIEGVDSHAKNAILLELTEWADSPQGADFRAGLAHGQIPSAVTAKDVLALMKDGDNAAEIIEALGIEMDDLEEEHDEDYYRQRANGA